MTALEEKVAAFDRALSDVPPARRGQLVALFALVLRQGRGAEEALTPAIRGALDDLLGWAVRNYAFRGKDKVVNLVKKAIASHAPTTVALLAEIETRKAAP